MSRIKDYLEDCILAKSIFGDFSHKYVIASDIDDLQEGQDVTLVNSNCEFEFDSITGQFEENLLYYYIVDLQLLELDLSNFEIGKSNNGGKYGFGLFKVLKIYDFTY